MHSIETIKQALATFACEEDGAQVVEYGLIIAVVSIVLVLALAQMGAGGTSGPFGELITRVTNCLKTGGTCS